MDYTGIVRRSSPKNFGGLTNAHAIKLEGPWNSTIEPIFNFADSNLPPIVASLASDLKEERSKITSQDRSARPYPKLREDRDAFAEGLASLVLRSPAFRNRIRLSTNHYRARFGQADVDARDGVIAANIHQWYPFAVTDFRNAFLGLLCSQDAEFIFGEGYLNNVSGSSHTFDLRAVLPLTPNLAVIAFSGSGLSPRSKASWLVATPDDVQAINELTQIYTKEFIYFRSQKPEILPEFARNEFRECRYHQDPCIESIIREIRATGMRP